MPLLNSFYLVSRNATMNCVLKRPNHVKHPFIMNVRYFDNTNTPKTWKKTHSTVKTRAANTESTLTRRCEAQSAT